MRNETIGAVQNTMYIGIHIDSSLDWKKHIQEISKKVMISWDANVFLSMHLKISTLVSLTLISGPAVLCRVCGATEVHPPQKIRNRAARIITGRNYNPSKPLIQTLGWKTINERIKFEPRVMVFIPLNMLAPQYLSNLFVPSSTNPSSNLRSTNTDHTLQKKNTSAGVSTRNLDVYLETFYLLYIIDHCRLCSI